MSDINDSFNFEQTSATLHALLQSRLAVEEIQRGQMDTDTAKRKLIEAINRGQTIVNYVGHGSVNLWRGNLLTSNDAGALTNRDRLPIFVTMTCLNGYFHDALMDSLADR